MTRRATNMFVCITLDLFDWVTHTGAKLPRRVFGCGGDTTTGASCHRPTDGHAHTLTPGKGKLHCVNKSRERVLSLSTTKPVCVPRLCAVDTTE
ncbi:unnamed protein product [Leptosia nina]|uniref:Secreted protein n=1 Tax=Leptosia nina TaxID=320188 RepID=A0AAV1J9G2_9NEOP